MPEPMPSSCCADQHHLPVGAELRGTTERRWRGMAPGSQKDRGFFAIPAEARATLVLCESAIDALSCFALHPDYRCLSTAGARPNPRWLRTTAGPRLPDLLRLRRRSHRRCHGPGHDHPPPSSPTPSSFATRLERRAHGARVILTVAASPPPPPPHHQKASLLGKKNHRPCL